MSRTIPSYREIRVVLCRIEIDESGVELQILDFTYIRLVRRDTGLQPVFAQTFAVSITR